MSLWRRGQQQRHGDLPTLAQDLIPSRTGRTFGSVHVNNETALRNSAVWACVRLISDLVSTMPLDVFTNNEGIVDTEVPKSSPKYPLVLLNPAPDWDINDWLF